MSQIITTTGKLLGVMTASLLLVLVKDSVANGELASRRRLISGLFQTSDTASTNIPPNIATGPINVSIGLGPMVSFILDEDNEVLETTLVVDMIWNDFRMAWDPLQYGVDGFWYPKKHFWLPDVAVENSVESQNSIGYNGENEDTKVEIGSEGVITWSQRQRIRTVCDIDLTFYPYDVQQCQIYISTGIYKDKVDLTPGQVILHSEYTAKGEWDLVDASVKKLNNSIITKPTVCLSIKLRRMRAMQTLTIVVPAILLAFTACLAFLVSGEKMGTAATVLLVYVVFFVFALDNMPSNCRQVSLTVVYMVFMLVVHVFAAVTSAWSLKLRHTPNTLPVGDSTKQIIKTLRSMFKMSAPTTPPPPTKINVYVEEPEKETGIRQAVQDDTPCERSAANPSISSGGDTLAMTWNLVAGTIDSLCFRITIGFVSFLTVVLVLTFVIYADRN